jgi:soluble lytic murein transglycosylase
MFDMTWAALVRLFAMTAVVACARPDEAPAQLDADASRFSRSRDAAVRAAAAALEAGRPWRATEMLDSAYRGAAARTPEVVLLSATAAAAWGGWQRVERDLTGATWLDSQFDGGGWELLARAALARGADSLAREDAARALSRASTDRDRGIREVLLARALDRQAMGDSAAATYLRAARHLPTIADWLELRAAGSTPDASRRQRSYARVSTDVARARVAPTEAQARERWRDYAGAARAYAELGDKAQALRLTLLASHDSGTRAKVRSETFALLAATPTPADARVAIELADSSFTPLSTAEEIVVARAATVAGMLARAAAGYARADRALDPQTRYAYGGVLSRLGRDADAAAQFGRIPANASLGALAAYQRARSLLRAGRGSDGRTALRRVARSFARDTNAAAPALFFLADLATDDGRDADAREGFIDLARRFPTSDLAPEAMFRAAIIAYAAGSFTAAARDFDALIARYPQSVEMSAARYWAGRAFEQAGDRKRAADRWREVTSTDPLSYYAMKSAGRLGITGWKPAQASDSIRLTRPLERAVSRAKLLDAAGMAVEEGFEYDALASVSSSVPDSLLAAADALRRLGEVSRAMGLARRALADSAPRDTRLFHLLYPVAYGDVIRAESEANGVDPALTAALIHQESSFNARATSRAGAVGLMQVLPSVGAEIATARGITGYERVLLYQPDVNVRLGMAHLAAMLRQYPSLEYALAAYNAGGSPVQRWRRKRGTDNPELFIERIPYDETRDYVRILLRNRAMYAMLYGW